MLRRARGLALAAGAGIGAELSVHRGIHTSFPSLAWTESADQHGREGIHISSIAFRQS
jgi:hypothetical protein